MQIFRLATARKKSAKFLIWFLETRVSFSSNLASFFSVMRHNSSVLFHLNLYMLWTKGTHQSAIFQTSDCLDWKPLWCGAFSPYETIWTDHFHKKKYAVQWLISKLIPSILGIRLILRPHYPDPEYTRDLSYLTATLYRL